MSLDIVDDLQAAEDRIAELEDILIQLLAMPGGTERDRLFVLAEQTLTNGWCRPTCERHEHGDLNDTEAEDCGCPAHEYEDKEIQ